MYLLVFIVPYIQCNLYVYTSALLILYAPSGRGWCIYKGVAYSCVNSHLACLLLLLLFIDHTQNGTQYIYTIHMEYKHVQSYKTNIYKYIRINQLQLI